MARGEETTFQFLVCGEGGYQVVAHVDAGVELRGADGYVESGYRATAVLREKSIESTIDPHAYWVLLGDLSQRRRIAVA